MPKVPLTISTWHPTFCPAPVTHPPGAAGRFLVSVGRVYVNTSYFRIWHELWTFSRPQQLRQVSGVLETCHSGWSSPPTARSRDSGRAGGRGRRAFLLASPAAWMTCKAHCSCSLGIIACGGSAPWVRPGGQTWRHGRRRLRHRALLCDHGCRRRLPSLASPQCHQIVEPARGRIVIRHVLPPNRLARLRSAYAPAWRYRKAVVIQRLLALAVSLAARGALASGRRRADVHSV